MTTDELVNSFVVRHTRKRDHLLRDKMRREINEIIRRYRSEILRFDFDGFSTSMMLADRAKLRFERMSREQEQQQTPSFWKRLFRFLGFT